MSRRRDLERHREQLDEMHEILNSMKMLAFMESRKLGEIIATERAVVRHIDATAQGFLTWWPALRPAPPPGPRVCVLLGSERGFCGDFSEAVARAAGADAAVRLIAVGHKLHGLLLDDPRVTARLDGASVAEEIPSLLTGIVEALAQARASLGPCQVEVALHPEASGGVVRKPLLPPFPTPPADEPRRPRPLLYLSPEGFLGALVEQYLFAALKETICASLLAENTRRMAHLDNASRHLEDRIEALRQRTNTLRQEEITEELEVILLSVENRMADRLRAVR